MEGQQCSRSSSFRTGQMLGFYRLISSKAHLEERLKLLLHLQAVSAAVRVRKDGAAERYNVSAAEKPAAAAVPGCCRRQSNCLQAAGSGNNCVRPMRSKNSSSPAPPVARQVVRVRHHLCSGGSTERACNAPPCQTCTHALTTQQLQGRQGGSICCISATAAHP